jgi:acylphosphatase
MFFSKMKCFNYLVSGKVQGVCFRAETKKIADNLNIKGWIKNLKNGKVEIVAQIEEKQLQKFENWLKRGPKNAKVEYVKTQEVKCSKDFENFEIIF